MFASIEAILPTKVYFQDNDNKVVANLRFDILEVPSLLNGSLEFNMVSYLFAFKGSYDVNNCEDTGEEYLMCLDFDEVEVFRFIGNTNKSVPVILSKEEEELLKSKAFEKTAVYFKNKELHLPAL